jgi:elongation factor G
LIDRLKREFGVGANVGKPQVAYRETFERSAEAEGRFVRQTGGRGQYGHVVIKLEPMSPGFGFEFRNELKGGVIPREFVPSVEKGVIEAMSSGVLAGYPVVDIKVTLLDGSSHPVDSSEMAFKIAGSIAFKEASKKSSPYLLEPIMAVEIITPSEYLGDVIGNLQQRRSKIDQIKMKASMQIVSASSPLAEMFGYATDLRSITQGRASYTMQFSHYARVPKDLADRVTGVSLFEKIKI